MRVAISAHDSSLRHDSGWGHPERPARITAALDGVEKAGLDILRIDPPLVARQELAAVHDPAYIDEVERFCGEGGGLLDPDTHVGVESWEAALRAAGAGPALIGVLEAGEADCGFSIMRPPGHHALAARAMGFCMFNNIAVAAMSLRRRGHKVAIVDWDVHHGNGTQDTFYANPDVLYVSVHEWPFYPGTGAIEEIGAAGARGTTLNLPFAAGTEGSAYVAAFDQLILDVMEGFAPDWLLVSAGYDAHRNDPLAGMRLVANDYGVMAERLGAVVVPSRSIFFLEGGYNLDAITSSVSATLEGVAGTLPPVSYGLEDRRAASVIEHATQLRKRHR